MANGDDVRVAVLGTIEVGEGEASVALSPQLRRLLGLLVVAGGAVVSADRLAEYVADGNVEGSTVRTAVSRLRKVLGDRIESVDGGYRLVMEPDELDVARFEQLVTRARSASGEAEVAALSRALELWRGPALGDLAGEEWASGWAARLDGVRATAVEDLAETLVREGRCREVIELLEEHVREHPYRERPVELLMRAMASDGRVADGLRVFERFRVTLRDDTGLEPSRELRAVETELLTVSSGGDRPGLPTGTVTFLFTDIEGSTARWAQDEAAMTAALAAHDAVLRDVVGSHGGVVFKHTGDGVCAVFASAPAAVAAAIEATGRLGLPVRMGIHTGEAELRDGDYFGPTLNRVARIMDAGHGGQILLSRAAVALVPDVAVVDVGEHRLKGLASPERIFQVGDGEFPALRVASSRKGNLPGDLTTFVGRDDELASVVEHLTAHRLVTLLGVGGTGKTRLAIEAASALSPMFPDGCWLVELAQLAVPEAVGVATCVGIGIAPPESGDPVDVVVRRLQNERRLIVIDNCEHVLDAAAGVIERIVATCPSVSVIATSREPLMVAGEQLVPTPSLSHDDAVALFLARARAEAPDLSFESQQREAIDRLCDRLDRLPLAIELAASRMRSMSPMEAVDRLDQRFRLLVGGRRSRMERHQTMRGTVEWSYDLCSALEQRVFDRISVFATDFELSAAVAVAGDHEIAGFDVEDALARLVDRSLVHRQVDDGGTSRFRLLETMRAFGHERLAERGEADLVRERHAAHTDAILCELGLRSLGPDEQAIHARIRALAPEALLALDWSIDGGDGQRAYRIASSSYYASSGMSIGMFRRIHTSADERLLLSMSPLQRFVLDGFPSSDRSSEVDLDAIAEQTLSLMQQRSPMPSDHFSFGPLLGGRSGDEGSGEFGDGSRGHQVLSVMGDWLRSLAGAPSTVRFQETVFAAEIAREEGRPEDAKGYEQEARRLAEGLDSDLARRRCCSLELLQMEDDDGAVRSDVVAVRALLDDIDQPTGGDVLLAARYLRAATQFGIGIDAVDLRRPYAWMTMLDVGHVAAHLSTAVALARIGALELAARVVAVVGPDQLRPECARLYERQLPLPLLEALRHQPAGAEPIDEVVAAVFEYADGLARLPP